MAPKKQATPSAKPAPKAAIQDMAPRPALPAHKPSAKSGPSSMLFSIGLCSALFGLAATIGPKLSWKAGQVMQGLDSLGVHGGAFIMGGLALLGIAAVLREVAQVSASLSQSGEDTSLLESVAADVLQVGSVVEGLQASAKAASGELVALRASVAALGEQAAAARTPDGGLGSEDAIFRLAASLDKVGAKIEERLKAQFGELSERIGKLEGSVADTTRRLERLQAPAPIPPAHRPAYAPPALQQTAHYPAPLPGQQPAYAPPGQPALHQTAHRPTGMQFHPHPPPSPQPPAENPHSLGLLDQLDDHGVVSPLATGAPLSFDAPPTLLRADAPHPADPWANPPGIPLNPVMSDPEVRAALENMGRQPGR
jgi:hypothetical protein